LVLLIAAKVRQKVRERLADVSTGLNPNLIAVCADSNYAITRPMQIDFGASTKQFWQGEYDPRQLDSTTITNYPLLIVYTVNESNQNQQKWAGARFSGSVTIIMQAWITWRNSKALRDSEVYGDAFVAAMFETFNAPSTAAHWQAVGWNGGLTASRGPVDLAGEDFIQNITFTASFNSVQA